ncbi:MAG: calcium-binding protein [Actinomycetota bacterium]
MAVLLLVAMAPGAGALESRVPATCNGLLVTTPGGRGADTLNGTTGDDVIHGGLGADQIDGKGGNDTICGGPGADTIDGGDGVDTIFGEGGNHRITGDGGGGSDAVYGGPGSDRVKEFLVFWGNGDDLTYGDAGSDDLDGGRDDYIVKARAGREEGARPALAHSASEACWPAETRRAGVGYRDAFRLVSGLSARPLRGGPGHDRLDTGAPDFGETDDDGAWGDEGNDYGFGKLPGLPSGATRPHGGIGNDRPFSATLYVGGPGLDWCDASPIISAAWKGGEVVWTCDRRGGRSRRGILWP